MKKVLLFKGVSEDYQSAFNDNNFQTLFVEPLQFDFLHLKELREKLLQTDYDGLILTSPRAIEAVSKVWDPLKFTLWHTKRIYTVGEASAHKVKLLLALEAMGATTGNAENLAKTIAQENSSGARFLFPCGSLRSEILPNILTSQGITVDSLTVYETKENENLKTDLMKINEQECPCCVVFFSPSGCEYIHRQLQTFDNRLSNLPHFAIGNATAHKIENLGIEIAGIAEKPKADSLVGSVQEYFLRQ